MIVNLDRFDVTDNDYEKFFYARAAAISAQLKRRFIEWAVDARGHAQRSDDFEEKWLFLSRRDARAI